MARAPARDEQNHRQIDPHAKRADLQTGNAQITTKKGKRPAGVPPVAHGFGEKVSGSEKELLRRRRKPNPKWGGVLGDGGRVGTE
jgi:hypothetical protein